MKIGLLGFGTVGQGVEDMIFHRSDVIEKKLGESMEVKTILVKDLEKERNPVNPEMVFTDNFENILYDDEIDTIVEVTSDIDETYGYLKAAIESGKNVVTANKAVVSRYFEELSKLAEEHNVAFLYEASVAGAIPIIKPLTQSLPLDDIGFIRGILNGTCNYILTNMQNNSEEYADVLKKAQDLGYAEADPSADVDGFDTQRKLRILATLALRGKVEEEFIDLKGISSVSKEDIEVFNNCDYKVKLIGEAGHNTRGAYAVVMPTLCPKNSFFYGVNMALNGVEFRGSNVGELRFFGAGAGQLPTADSILRDLMDIGMNSYVKGNPLTEDVINIYNDGLFSEFYIRVPKSKAEELKNVAEEIMEFENSVAAFTKNITLKDVKDLVEDLDGDEYFYARILGES